MLSHKWKGRCCAIHILQLHRWLGIENLTTTVVASSICTVWFYYRQITVNLYFIPWQLRVTSKKSALHVSHLRPITFGLQLQLPCNWNEMKKQWWFVSCGCKRVRNDVYHKTRAGETKEQLYRFRLAQSLRWPVCKTKCSPMFSLTLQHRAI